MENGHLINSRNKIFQNKLNSILVFDIFPICVILLCNYSVINNFFIYLCLIKIFELDIILTNLIEAYHIAYKYPLCTKLLEILFTLGILIHYISCFLVIISSN